MSALIGAAEANVGIGWRHPHYRELLSCPRALNFLEVHSENFFGPGGAALAVLEQGRAQYPISLHGVGLSLGSTLGLDEWHLAQLARLVERIDPIRISDHASFARARLPGGIVHAADLLPLPFTDEALSVLSVNVQRVQDRLGRRLMVENLSSYLTWPQEAGDALLTEPDFLSTLARRTGCALLVDVNNLYVNALNAQINGVEGEPVAHCLRWLDGIGAGEVGEIHLAGHCRMPAPPGEEGLGEIVIDDHGSRVSAPVWQIYAYAIARFGVVPSLIEWDTDVPALSVLLAEAELACTVMRERGVNATEAPP